MDYKGVIIEESLSDKNILSTLNIVSTEVEEVSEKHATPCVKTIEILRCVCYNGVSLKDAKSILQVEI